MEAELNANAAEMKQLRTSLDEKTKELFEIQLKFNNFITENQKLRLKEKINSDCLKLDARKKDLKIAELEKLSKRQKIEEEK